ncbi:MAG: AtpZ/AtpI family protein [Polyangiaceae bacterium]|nr:AtpZ/AtpI family protein [Polyangiaceae bacterium]
MASMRGMKAFGRYGSLGFELLASIAVGYYGGRWLDRKLDTHFLAIVGFFIGCYAGFRTLFVAAKQMQRDIENEERLERGEDPWAPPEENDDDEPPKGTP